MCAASLWKRLLHALARPDCPPAPFALEHWIVSACRRAARLRGPGLVAVAKRLGFLSALRVPSLFLPMPDLSEIVARWIKRTVEHVGDGPSDAEANAFLRFYHRLGRRLLPV